MNFSEDDFNNNLMLDIKNDQKMIIKLKSLLKIIGDNDPYKLENEYFKKYECNTELDKIVLVSKYLNFSLSKYITNNDIIKEDVEKSINTISSIIMLIENDVKLTNEVVRLMKRTLLKIALTFDINIMFLSEIENLYDDIKEKYNEKTKGLTK